LARFVRHDTSEENMRMLWAYLGKFGRPLAFYTDKAGMFQVAVKSKRDQEREGRDRPEMPPTQIARALRELDIVWIPAHSPQAKGRIERQFLTGQDRLVKGMRVAGVRTLEQANAYLENEYLPWWNRTLVVQPANLEDAHRGLSQDHDLGAILSHIEPRQVLNNYTVRYRSKLYQIDRRDIQVGLRKAKVQIEHRLDGSIHMRFQGRYLRIRRCAEPLETVSSPAVENPRRLAPTPRRKSNWMKGFLQKPGPSLEEAIRISNAHN
jgi:hypothetical protein